MKRLQFKKPVERFLRPLGAPILQAMLSALAPNSKIDLPVPTRGSKGQDCYTLHPGIDYVLSPKDAHQQAVIDQFMMNGGVLSVLEALAATFDSELKSATKRAHSKQ